MAQTIGDGMVALALAAGIVGYVYVNRQSRLKRLEMIHKERLVAMEKGIPLAEFPLEPAAGAARARSERGSHSGDRAAQPFAWHNACAVLQSCGARKWILDISPAVCLLRCGIPCLSFLEA